MKTKPLDRKQSSVEALNVGSSHDSWRRTHRTEPETEFLSPPVSNHFALPARPLPAHAMSAIDTARFGVAAQKSTRLEDAKAKLSKGALSNLTTIVADVRKAVGRLGPPGSAVLNTLCVSPDNFTVVSCMRDLFELLNNEDPEGEMPIRRVLGDWNVVRVSVIPVLLAVHADPFAADEPKRWATCMYHTLRLLSILSVPIDEGNSALLPGCNTEIQLMDLKHTFASNPIALHPIVSLLQFYMQRKAEKMESLSAAQDAKLEDARIDNILRFFRNLLTPPRSGVNRELMGRDRGTHIALVGAMGGAVLFDTLSILFASEEDARAQYTNIVYIVSEIYSLAFRHSTARDLARAVRPRSSTLDAAIANTTSKAVIFRPAAMPKGEPQRSVFDEADETPAGADGNFSDAEASAMPAPTTKSIASIADPAVRTKSSVAAAFGLRAALQRERSLIVGSRSVVASARWANRHSGGFISVAKPTPAAAVVQPANRAPRGSPSAVAKAAAATAAATTKRLMSKRIVSARNMTSGQKAGAAGVMQAGMRLNSEILCLLGAKGRPRISIATGKSSISRHVRSDLIDKGRKALGQIAQQLVNDCFSLLITELRERITDSSLNGSDDESWMARRFYLILVATVTGFQHELGLMIASAKVPERHVASQSIKSAAMEAALGVPRTVKIDWEAVESAINLESFKLVFDSVLVAREDKNLVKEMELATAAVKEMMKMLQSMTVSAQPAPVENPDEPVFGKGCENVENDYASYPVIGVGRAPSSSRRTTLSLNCENALTKDDDIEGEIGDNEATISTSDGHDVTPENQCAMAVDKSSDDEELPVNNKMPTFAPERPRIKLSPREIALNTLEELFEREEYLEAPSMLAKEFDSRVHSFGHLANVIEIAFTFTATLLDNDLTHITVSRKRKRKKSKAKKEIISRISAEVEYEAGGCNDQKEISPGENGEHNDDKCFAFGAVGDEDDGNLLPAHEAEANPRSKAEATAGVTYNSAMDSAVPTEEVLHSAIRAEHVEDAVGNERDDLENGDISDNDDDYDNDGYVNAVCEIEGTDVIRRFAHPKALQHIALAIRAGMCKSSDLSGLILPMPESSGDLIDIAIVAKSVAVLQSVWRVIETRERGAFRCAFYNYAMLHLLGVAMAAADMGDVADGTVLGSIALFGRDVTKEFFAMLTVNPSLLMDSLFFMDLSTQRMYTNKRYLAIQMRAEQELRERGELVATDEDTDSETCEAEVFVPKSQTRKPPKSRKARKSGKVYPSREVDKERKAIERLSRRRARVSNEDEDDIDDLDNLAFGSTPKAETYVDSEANGDGGDKEILSKFREKKPRGGDEWRKRKRLSSKGDSLDDDGSSHPDNNDDSSTSDSGSDEGPVRNLSRRKDGSHWKPAAKRTKSVLKKKPKIVASKFSSDDEYSDSTFAAIKPGKIADEGCKPAAVTPAIKNTSAISDACRMVDIVVSRDESDLELDDVEGTGDDAVMSATATPVVALNEKRSLSEISKSDLQLEDEKESDDVQALKGRSNSVEHGNRGNNENRANDVGAGESISNEDAINPAAGRRKRVVLDEDSDESK
jgi:hypothetical protein